MRNAINATAAPEALGPYSQAIEFGDTLWCSGQIGIDRDGQLAAGCREQIELALDNLTAICKRAGYRLTNALQATVYLADLADFETVNEVFAARFKEPFPARVCVQVAGLPRGAAVEIALVVGRSMV